MENNEVIKINNWSIIYTLDNPYQAPELAVPRLRGFVDEHPTLGKNFSQEPIITSQITGAYERLCITLNGHVYELGLIDPDYQEFLNKIDYKLDEEYPVKV